MDLEFINEIKQAELEVEKEIENLKKQFEEKKKKALIDKTEFLRKKEEDFRLTLQNELYKVENEYNEKRKLMIKQLEKILEEKENNWRKKFESLFDDILRMVLE